MIVVDDADVVCNALAFYFSTIDNIEVVGTASDGQTAYDLCCALKPDIVVMDIYMPVMDGLTVASLIRHMFPAMIIILVSASLDPENIAHASAAGANSYLSKWHWEDLIQAVGEVCSRSQGE
jgi:two-component system secretion response regulator SsrB